MTWLTSSRCDVSDALLKLKHPHGGFLTDLILWSPDRQSGDTKIIGPAYTVKYVPVADTESPKLAGHYVSRCHSQNDLRSQSRLILFCLDPWSLSLHQGP